MFNCKLYSSINLSLLTLCIFFIPNIVSGQKTIQTSAPGLQETKTTKNSAAIANKATLEYGPLFAYDEKGKVRVSFGLKLKHPVEVATGKISLKLNRGINPVILEWNPYTARFLESFKEFGEFKEHLSTLNYPKKGKPGKYRVLFGSCASAGLDEEQLLYSKMADFQPDAFMIIGDFIYNDYPPMDFDNLEIHAKYYRQLKLKNFRKLASISPIYNIWDDHDYWENDSDRETVSEKNRRLTLKYFTAIFPNPGYGEKGEGVYFKWSLGDVDFFMLDTRWFRVTEDKIMLGETQNSWLRRELKNSQATFKVLVSSVEWQEKGRDGSWKNFIEERNRLFRFIFSEKIKGVFLLSGDTHHASAYRLLPTLDVKGKYDLIEFTSSGIATRPRNAEAKKSVNVQPLLNVKNKVNFGELAFNTSAEDPFVDLKLHTKDEQPSEWFTGGTFYRIYARELK